MTPRLVVIALAAGLVAGTGLIAKQTAEHSHTSGMFVVPAVVKAEHDKLHEDLAGAVKAGGKTGEAAERVAAALHPHFQSEEAFALPPLGVLHAIAEGQATPEMRKVVALTDRLQAEMPRMLNEHRTIAAALEDLGAAATAEHHPAVSLFVKELTAHAQTEEQLLYPAAIVAGEYLKLKFPR